MLSESQIREIARRNRIPAGVAEKDYVLTKILYSISKSDLNLVFKGGTAIKKAYLETGRFSEDLDFTVLEESDFKKEIKQIIKQLDIKMKVKKFNKLRLSRSFRISFVGPLNYKNSFKIDLSLREKPELDPVKKEILHFYPDIPSFKFKVLQLEEVLAEKLRAAYTRGTTRDILDIYSLSKLNLDKQLLKRLFLKKLKNVGIEEAKGKRFRKTIKNFNLSDITYLLPASVEIEGKSVRQEAKELYSYLFK